MAGTPRGHNIKSVLTMFLLSGFLIGLSGCEVGRTMFQFSSGSSSPWVGIDLLPRKKSPTTKITHKKIAEPASKQSQEVQVALQREPVMTKFSKKPVRLNLPSSPLVKKSNKLIGLDTKSSPVPTGRLFDF